jgi:hypothetical protein
MNNDSFAALPVARREAARSAIHAVLGSAAIVSARPVTGGVSGAAVFLIEARDRRFVLRLEGPASPLRNPHQYIAMRIAAEKGIAPRIHYLDASEQVVMMDFIEDRPLETYPGGREGLARAIGTMLRQLQSLPLFPDFVDYPSLVDRLWTHVCKTGLFAQGVLDAASQRLAELRKAYALHPEQYVSSHNDFLPRNVLFDGERLWLIDWENSYRNDPLIDLATVLDNFAPSPELEEVLLQARFGQAPDHLLRDRLALARSLTRLFYTGVLFCAPAPQTTPDADLSAPTSAEFEQLIRTGRLLVDTPETSRVLGKMFLVSFLTGTVPPGLPPMYMR